MAGSRPRVIVACFDRGQLLDMAGPVDCFDVVRTTRPELAAARYDIALVSARGGLVEMSSGVRVETVPFASLAPRRSDTVMVSGGMATLDDVHPALVDELRRFAPRVRRVCSICTGAFVLAASGLADGRPLATHWRFADELQRRHPSVWVRPDAIFCRDGPLWSSAGITAGIDMTLAILEEDLGSDVAATVARDIVVYLRRPGGQSQFSRVLDLETRCRDRRVHDLVAWIGERLDRSLDVERLAERMHTSPRNLARLCRAETGLSPAKLVEAVRLERARQLLETGERPVAQIASSCGFGREENLRRAFRRALGTTPLLYRRHHGAGGGGGVERVG